MGFVSGLRLGPERFQQFFPKPDSVRANRVVVVPLTVRVATIAHTYADHISPIFLKRKTYLKGKHLLRANNAYDLFDSQYYNC